MAKRSPQDLADVLFPNLTDDELAESILSIPPEQRRLHTETYDFSVSTLLEYLSKKTLKIPEFQRRYVWSQPQGSRLIESLIIQCPIPVIYLNQEKDETLSVIDGNQRIRTLDQYSRDDFALKGLTAYPELEGLRFSELDPRFQRHIMNRTLRCIVIMKDTHPQVKFDVFERLNSGAARLSPQELRHGIYYGKFMKLVVELAKDKRWRGLFPGRPEKRMRSEEFVIRFFALHDQLEQYRKPLSAFLNDYSETKRNADDAERDRLKALFSNTLDGLIELYGDFAFKIFRSNWEVVSAFNAALFDAEMLSISRRSAPIGSLPAAARNTFLQQLAALLQDPEFHKTIARATSDEILLKRRVEAVRALVDSCIP